MIIKELSIIQHEEKHQLVCFKGCYLMINILDSTLLICIIYMFFSILTMIH
jgi:hypothetical protein